MTLMELCGVRNVVTVEIRGLDGELIELVTLQNKITTVGLNMLRDITGGIIADAEIKYMAWGDDNTGVSAAHTALQNERGRKAVTSKVAGAAGILTTTTYVAPYEATGFTIEELGWFCGAAAGAGADSGIMIGRVLYSRTKTVIESLNVVRTDTYTET